MVWSGNKQVICDGRWESCNVSGETSEQVRSRWSTDVRWYTEASARQRDSQQAISNINTTLAVDHLINLHCEGKSWNVLFSMWYHDSHKQQSFCATSSWMKNAACSSVKHRTKLIICSISKMNSFVFHYGQSYLLILKRKTAFSLSVIPVNEYLDFLTRILPKLLQFITCIIYVWWSWQCSVLDVIRTWFEHIRSSQCTLQQRTSSHLHEIVE